MTARNDTPLARGVRTFVFSLAGFATSWMAIDWINNWRVGVPVLTLNLITAVLAGVVAALQAVSKWKATKTWTKALVQFAQVAAPGLAALGLAQLSKDALVNFGRGLISTLIGATLAALTALVTNHAENRPAPARYR